MPITTISELEEVISLMVKSSQKIPNILQKPSWWPDNLEFRYPVDRRHYRQLNWRETLQDLVSKCCHFNNSKRRNSTGQRILPERSSRRSLGVPTMPHTSGYKKYQKQKMESNDWSLQSGSSKRKIHMLGGKKCSAIFAKHNRIRRDSTSSSVGSTSSSSSDCMSSLQHLEGINKVTMQRRTNRVMSLQHSEDSLKYNSDLSRTCKTKYENSPAKTLAANFGLVPSLANHSITPIKKIYNIRQPIVSLIKSDFSNNEKYSKIKKCDTNNKEKDNFLKYFELDNKTKCPKPDNTYGESSKAPETSKNQTIGHPLHLINCPSIPFSSDLGIKLIKGRNSIDPTVFERRLERVERYLGNNHLPTLLSKPKSDFKVTYNKKSDPKFNHFYTFRTKKRHPLGKLSARTRFIQETYCKPCTVKLTCLDPCFIKTCTERKSDDFDERINKENISLNPTPFKTPFIKIPTVALKTLTPRNENVLKSTTNLFGNYSQSSLDLTKFAGSNQIFTNNNDSKSQKSSSRLQFVNTENNF